MVRSFRWLKTRSCYSLGGQSFGCPQTQFMENMDCFWSDLFSRFDFICTSDGSYSQNSHGLARTGIGGVIKDSFGSVRYIFSGPSQANSALKAELEALEFLVRVISSIQKECMNIIFYSDSIEAVNCVRKKWIYEDIQNLFLTSVKATFLQVPREFNTEADVLAKEGAKRLQLIGAWI